MAAFEKREAELAEQLRGAKQEAEEARAEGEAAQARKAELEQRVRDSKNKLEALQLGVARAQWAENPLEVAKRDAAKVWGAVMTGRTGSLGRKLCTIW